MFSNFIDRFGRQKKEGKKENKGKINKNINKYWEY